MNAQSSENSGLLFALGAYLMWGFFPIYWKFLDHVPSLEILAHRMVWSLFFMMLVLYWRRQFAWLRLLDRRTLATYFFAAIFLATNWGTYIYGVNSGNVVETALGYFINPLISVVFGAIFLGERPRVGQWIAIGLATVAVLYLTLNHGSVPYIALTLATTFALYGLIKKRAKLGALEGVSLESALLFFPALGFLIFSEFSSATLQEANVQTLALLFASGIATMLPLMCFAAALRRLSLTVIGVMQYLAPSIQFSIGVLLYHEPMDTTRFTGFVLIWIALALFTLEGFWKRRQSRIAIDKIP